MTYTEKAPTISKHITKENFELVAKEEKAKGGSNKKEPTKADIEGILPYLKWHDANFFPPGKEQYDLGYGQIGSLFGLTKEQVADLHKEYKDAEAEVLPKPAEKIIT